MALYRIFRLYSECFKLAKLRGLIACTKYLCGLLPLDHLSSKSSDFAVGAEYV